VWPIGVRRYGRGKQEVRRPSIFVVEAVHIICCTGNRLQKTGRKSWEAILGLRYFELAKVVTESAARAKEKRLTVTWSTRCKRCCFGHPLTLFFDISCPGNERCAVVCGPYAVVTDFNVWKKPFSLSLPT
jgi:hypothetical protein